VDTGLDPSQPVDIAVAVAVGIPDGTDRPSPPVGLTGP